MLSALLPTVAGVAAVTEADVVLVTRVVGARTSIYANVYNSLSLCSAQLGPLWTVIHASLRTAIIPQAQQKSSATDDRNSCILSLKTILDMLAILWLRVETPKFTYAYQIQRFLEVLNSNTDRETSTTAVRTPLF